MKNTVRDPICGMDVDPENAAAVAERDGDTFYFCAEHSRDRFGSGRGAAERESEHSCCGGVQAEAAPAEESHGCLDCECDNNS